jgi:mono/diheme cytochrome c family protein
MKKRPFAYRAPGWLGWALLYVIVPAGTLVLASLAGGQATPKGKPANKAKAAPPAATGKALFAKSCASCHGTEGKGGPAYAKPLRGTKSVTQLATYIHQAMPPPGKRTPTKESQLIAAYMHETFYSPIAEERRRAARVELARLTARQYRNAVSDLIDEGKPPLAESKEQGLEGKYLTGSNIWEDKNKVFERIDPGIAFDFGTQAPGKEKFDSNEFVIRWDGSVIAPDTGEYEFIVHTDHAIKLWVNDLQRPLIDRWVKSGNETEYKGTVRLVGGRPYPLWLHFAKAQQGVDDQKKKRPDVPAFVRLEWRRPGRGAEVIPGHLLRPKQAPSRYTVLAPLPADDRSMGFERGAGVSKAWSEATTAGAIEAARYLTANGAAATGVPENAPDRAEKLKAYAASFTERAFRRPLDPVTRRIYVDAHFAAAKDPVEALKRSVILTLKSPRFLYRELGGPNDPYRVAAELSFSLWDSLPDAALREAAAKGELATAEGRERHARRMSEDPRAAHKLKEFLITWMKADSPAEPSKSAKVFPDFSPAVMEDLRTSFELSLDQAVHSPEADLRQLFLDRRLFLNERLGKLYGYPVKGTGFQPVQATDGRRWGVLTHPYLMTRLAYIETTSPIHRGVMLTRNILGRPLMPPPMAFTPLAPSLHPSLTTRERVTMQTKPPACMGCHVVINPLGFALENYDAIGRFRTQEKGKPVNAAGSYQEKGGRKVAFSGAGDLARYLAASPDTRSAFTQHLFQFMTKQGAPAYGADTVPRLAKDFEMNRWNMRHLMVKVAVTAASAPTP